MLHLILNPIISVLLIVAALFISDGLSRKQALSDANRDLIASATEQSATLKAVWEGQINTLNVAAIGLAEYDEIELAPAMRRLSRLADESAFQYVTFAMADGICYASDGKAYNVSDRAYFQKAMAGSWAVQKITDAKNGDGVIIMLAVPIVKDGTVIGIVQGGYTKQLLADLLVPNMYEGEAFALICREDGHIAIDSDNPNYLSTSDNIYAEIEPGRLENGKTPEMIKAEIAAGETGSVTYRIHGEKRYAVYVPLEFYAATGERLVMLNVIPAKLIDAAAEKQSLFNVLLFGMVFLAAVITFAAYFYSLRKANRHLQQERDQLQISEEQNRIAVQESGINLFRYDLKTKTLYSDSSLTSRHGYGETVLDVPEEFIRAGLVAPECEEEYRAFFQSLCNGEIKPIVSALKDADGSFRWYRMKASFVYDAKNKPYQAIIVFEDVTERREQAAVYTKWQQSMEQRPQESYTLFRCNLTKSTAFDSMEGALLTICFKPGSISFNERTREYAGRFVHLDDYEAYVALLDSEYLLAGYYRGIRTASMEYRERVTEGEYRWLRVTVEITKYPESKDIHAFLLYENIDAEKTAELSVKAQIEADPLTGVLNRSAFVEQFGNLILVKQPRQRHALLLIDIDGFKKINDNFGHTVGDQALVDIANALRTVLREGDLLGRLGGDEFILCINNVFNQTLIEKRATQIQSLLRKVFSVDVQITASIGIAVFPDDGKDVITLYHNLDMALHHAKANGRETFAFFNGELMKPVTSDRESDTNSRKEMTKKRHILIVDDHPETVEAVNDAFSEQYHIEACSDEKNAMTRLRRYGISVSVVLLNMDIPGMDSLAFLERMRGIEGIKTVPVITLGNAKERERCVNSLREGASDFILTPIDSALLRIRITSAISKAENERLRAQNTYLQTQSSEGSKFRTVFAHTGTVVVEYDWVSGLFSYDPAISEHIYGVFDERPLWQILMSDMVADAMDVKAMQVLVHDLATDRTHTGATLDIMLKTPAKTRHWFTMNAFKRVDDMNLTSKIILTFLDVNDDILASKKLRFQAEHDSLTGLYNRTFFLKLVEETVRSKPANSYILLCCDINDFRFINERFGRDEGDRLLQFSAEKLLVYADDMNGFAGRLSNDVYAILFPNSPGAIERATAIVRDFFSDYPLKARITGRAGAYIIADPTITADTMLDFAITASSAIKGKFAAWLAVYDESMNEKRIQEKLITDHMESALAQGQFDVYIQPQIHHATGQIVGAEALVRWIDPERGIVLPNEFIPIFEKNGFITKLDEYVWDRTAQYVGAWIKKGNTPVPIAVNVSREDTKDPALCSKLLAIIQKYNIPIELFRLEITESLFAEDTERLSRVVEQLHECGFLIEMDDFGSGYSSLNILKDVPVDIIKLDMKFFSGEDQFGRGGMIINAVLRMARWLNMPVIAEGVEAKEQADFLMSIGCQTIQGYLYEQPMPSKEFEAKFLENQIRQGEVQNSSEQETDMHEFWNPASFDSLIFNRFIGPAAILEYHNGAYELVRMNKRLINALQISADAMPPAIAEEDKPRMISAVQEAIASGDDVKVHIGCVLGDGSRQQYLVTLRVVVKSEDRVLLFAAVDV